MSKHSRRAGVHKSTILQRTHTHTHTCRFIVCDNLFYYTKIDLMFVSTERVMHDLADML